jgi:hypothetical protein
MRTRTVLALGLLLTMASAGCARDGNGDDTGVATANGGNPTASASASAATGDNADAALKFSQCMREHGMTWFPDPKPGGEMAVNIPPGAPKDKVDAAMEACKKYAPNGGEPPKMDAAAIEQARQMAKCMRENGVPNFPDPDANGQLKIDGNKLGAGPGDSTFEKADKICSKYRPAGPGGSSQTHVEGKK